LTLEEHYELRGDPLRHLPAEVFLDQRERDAIVQAYPRTPHFKEDIIQTLYDGIRHKPDTTFGNVKADVLADKERDFKRGNFCAVIRGSAWRG
jgi:hypothetical protein